MQSPTKSFSIRHVGWLAVTAAQAQGFSSVMNVALLCNPTAKTQGQPSPGQRAAVLGSIFLPWKHCGLRSCLACLEPRVSFVSLFQLDIVILHLVTLFALSVITLLLRLLR
jgi:hypothetical protein